MEQKITRLTDELLMKNTSISEEKARTWIELLWSDFEASYAKAGYDYQGDAVTEKVIRQWINSYGDRIHEFAATNPKYAHLLNEGE
ncbi:YfhJ family protein [Paenisporosarcina cavernae]|uniref:WVELL protein n=1 Tax=Paenisporosarcina cavernae TaxID=2320858 RepID=A0A385YXR2_9BACL|nr:YfhJ family protein [Paenisporosarcina cavernae]AYC30232.1 hypothetical protein D3873_10350 [Paenisporosarcina cavernae]